MYDGVPYYHDDTSWLVSSSPVQEQEHAWHTSWVTMPPSFQPSNHSGFLVVDWYYTTSPVLASRSNNNDSQHDWSYVLLAGAPTTIAVSSSNNSINNLVLFLWKIWAGVYADGSGTMHCFLLQALEELWSRCWMAADAGEVFVITTSNSWHY